MCDPMPSSSALRANLSLSLSRAFNADLDLPLLKLQLDLFNTPWRGDSQDLLVESLVVHSTILRSSVQQWNLWESGKAGGLGEWAFSAFP
jgi:hypothetical protein